MIRPRQDCHAALASHRVCDFLLSARDDDRTHISLACTAPNLNDHGHPANISQRLARQSCRSHTGWNRH
jgi:hypothetical protein